MKTATQKRKEAREARAADPYAYQRSQERKKPKRRSAPMYTRHRDTVVEEARAQLYDHVDRYQEYVDRNRDILLLRIFDMLEGLKKVAP